MLAYGKNVLYETDPKKIKKVYISKKEYISFLCENKIKYELLPKYELDKLINKNHQGIIIDMYDYEYYELKDINSDFVIMLDHLEDPHNFGSIIRTCACAGIKEIIIPKDRSVRVNETVMKVSSGLIDDVKIIMVTNLVDTIKTLKKDGYFIYSSEMDGTNYKEVDYTGKKVLILGNEGSGVSRLVKENSDFLVSIPMVSDKESLNVGVAAGILIYEMSLNE